MLSTGASDGDLDRQLQQLIEAEYDDDMTQSNTRGMDAATDSTPDEIARLNTQIQSLQLQLSQKETEISANKHIISTLTSKVDIKTKHAQKMKDFAQEVVDKNKKLTTDLQGMQNRTPSASAELAQLLHIEWKNQETINQLQAEKKPHRNSSNIATFRSNPFELSYTKLSKTRLSQLEYLLQRDDLSEEQRAIIESGIYELIARMEGEGMNVLEEPIPHQYLLDILPETEGTIREFDYTSVELEEEDRAETMMTLMEFLQSLLEELQEHAETYRRQLLFPLQLGVDDQDNISDDIIRRVFLIAFLDADFTLGQSPIPQALLSALLTSIAEDPAPTVQQASLKRSRSP